MRLACPFGHRVGFLPLPHFVSRHTTHFFSGIFCSTLIRYGSHFGLCLHWLGFVLWRLPAAAPCHGTAPRRRATASHHGAEAPQHRTMVPRHRGTAPRRLTAVRRRGAAPRHGKWSSVLRSDTAPWYRGTVPRRRAAAFCREAPPKVSGEGARRVSLQEFVWRRGRGNLREHLRNV